MILVTAANGNQGKLLVPKLLAAGEPLRACVQSETSAHLLRALGVHEVIVGNLSDPGVMQRAVTDVNKIYHVGPTVHPQEREMGFGMIDAAKAAGVEHFVFSSVLHSIITDLVQHEIKRDIEEHLLSSGLEFTILQPANYMLPLKLRPAFEEGVFRLSWSLDRLQSLVDIGDITEVAAKVLLDSEKHFGATYELVAPGRFTAHELGSIIAGVTGRDIRVEQISAENYLKAWFGEASPEDFPHQTRVLRSISARYSEHDFVGNPNVLSWLLERRPTSFAEFVAEQYIAYQARTS
jgi:uncharacterized protein YbjT (DUF2867 family)